MVKPLSKNEKRKVLRPVRPNLGIQSQYQKKLEAMIDAMHKSLVYWISAVYRANPPHAGMASDASPAMTMRKATQKLSRRWLKAFSDAAPKMAAHFADKSMGNAQTSMKSILKDAGFSVEFKMTRAANDGYQAVIGENVGLIKSIAQKHLSDVEGLVMRSVQHGRDLGALTDQLEARYGVTRRRAAFIARDQNNKATAIMDKIRSKELGIKTAIWVHSGGGKDPRESHMDADGEEYEIETGMQIDGEFIMPGELPNCRCVKRNIIPGFA